MRGCSVENHHEIFLKNDLNLLTRSPRLLDAAEISITLSIIGGTNWQNDQRCARLKRLRNIAMVVLRTARGEIPLYWFRKDDPFPTGCRSDRT